MRHSFDFSAPQANRRAHRLALACSLVLLILAGYFLSTRIQGWRDAQSEFEAADAALQSARRAEARQATLSQTEKEALAQHTKLLRGAVHHWTGLFEAIERAYAAARSAVSFTTVRMERPDGQVQPISIGGMASSVDAVLEFVQGLAVQPGVKGVRLLEHHRAGPGTQGVSFKLVFVWGPQVPPSKVAPAPPAASPAGEHT